MEISFLQDCFSARDRWTPWQARRVYRNPDDDNNSVCVCVYHIDKSVYHRRVSITSAPARAGVIREEKK